MSKGVKKRLRHPGREWFFLCVLLLCISLIIVSYTLTKQYREVLREQVMTRVELFMADSEAPFGELFGGMKNESEALSEQMTEVTVLSATRGITVELIEKTKYLEAVYFGKEGKIFDSDGVEYNIPANSDIPTLMSKGETAVSGLFNDPVGNMNRIAVYSPVKENSLMDSVILLYSSGILGSIKEKLNSKVISESLFLALCDDSGNMITMIENSGQIVDSNTNLFDSLWQLSGNKNCVDEIKSVISSGERGLVSLTVNGETYAISVITEGSSHTYCLIGLYEADEIYVNGYRMINVIMTSIFILEVIMVIISVYIVVTSKSIKEKIRNIGTFNSELNCLTQLGFERKAGELIKRYGGSKFAVIVGEFVHFDYIVRTNGESYTQEILKHFNAKLSDVLRLGEIYGYISGGKYAFLLHYREKEGLLARLKYIYNLTYEEELPKKYRLKLRFGICTVKPGDCDSINALITNATAAMMSSETEHAGENCKFYDELFSTKYRSIADIEVRMEQALSQNEFKVFYQPKLNIRENRIDGSEALIRWFVPEMNKFYPPQDFMPVFESNGFVSKIDRFVFDRVCRLMSERAAAGYRVFPVSVNISRFTASEEGFIEFCTEEKNKYRIPDGFITFEFTESAAFEDYSHLKSLTDSLKKNGFRCAIDDFGKGYSSFNLLKKNPDIDEIKLDVFFTEDILNNERAKEILESIVGLAKKLKIKVTQEGVEDRQTLDYLKEIGCDVVQGYIYSKPLSEEEFLKFVESRTFESEMTPSNTLDFVERRGIQADIKNR